MLRRLGLVAVAFAALTVLLVGSAAQARQATTVENLATVSFGGDSWTNFDLVAQGAEDVDWPVDVIFWGKASITKVYNKLGWAWSGSNMYMQLDDGNGPVWAASAGRKNALCTDTHLRLYADADGALSNQALGNYVLGTTHLDLNECGSSPSYGFNEQAESNLAARAEAIWGKRAVERNALFLPDGTSTIGLLGNTINLVVGNHTWDNNGYPTLIKVR